MIFRCEQPSDHNYSNYGERGITVCDRWVGHRDAFWNFVNDMGPRPEGFTLDRINNDGNYEPDNCRWADGSTQTINRGMLKSNTSNYRGVSLKKSTGRWQAKIRFHNKQKHIGYFTTVEEAAKAYDKAAIQLFGDKAKLNYE